MHAPWPLALAATLMIANAVVASPLPRPPLPHLAPIEVQATTPAPAAPTFVTTGTIEIGSPWSRATPPGQHIGAVYLVIRNLANSSVRLTGASSPVAGAMAIRNMQLVNGYMQLEPVPDGVEIGPKSEVEFGPGGLHLMLVGLKKLLRTGDAFPVTLNFADGTAVDVTAVVWDVGMVRTTTK
ncbi:copper chaperone PCu(A)C [Oryzibacter oryziterrae]|uniref:copper chaperone PCu(A)C n=1 Tax=Oryzibacter oryziterrae TaxID=2766474 RepID=UPI001F3138A4|nr:copper chaperone PCu(A)C [Oryzibacter oryziterrae]